MSNGLLEIIQQNDLNKEEKKESSKIKKLKKTVEKLRQRCENLVVEGMDAAELLQQYKDDAELKEETYRQQIEDLRQEVHSPNDQRGTFVFCCWIAFDCS